MARLAWVAVALVALWSGYWYVGQRGVETALAAWFDARRAEGWVAEYASLDTRGFPSRFDTTLTEVELADPHSGLAWSAPFFQILTLSYTPNHIILALPPQQVLATPRERLQITSDRMRGSIVFRPGTALEVQRSSFELAGVVLTSSAGWRAAIDSGQFALAQTETPPAHKVYFRADALRPSTRMLAFLDPGRLLPDVLRGVTLDMEVTFDANWDRRALEQRRPQPRAIRIVDFDAGWGELALQAVGELTVDARGLPEGRIDLRARNWRDMLRIARDTGLVPAGLVPTIENALAVLAQMNGNPETIDAPLTFRGGGAYLAGLPLGPAPRLVIP